MAPECFNLHLQAISMECYDDHRHSGRTGSCGERGHTHEVVRTDDRMGSVHVQYRFFGKSQKDGM